MSVILILLQTAVEMVLYSEVFTRKINDLLSHLAQKSGLKSPRGRKEDE